MADAADQSENYHDMMLQEAQGRRKRYEGVSATDCEECDEPIPEPRRVALPGVRLCVDCQEREERRNGR